MKHTTKYRDYVSTIDAAGVMAAYRVRCRGSMDAVNNYMVHTFDAVPDIRFTVSTVPAGDVPDACVAGMPTLYTGRAPTWKSIEYLFSAAGFHVSMENSKLGKIPNMSLTPGRTCSADARRTCYTGGCYACDSYRQYPETRNAWNENTLLAEKHIERIEYVLSVFFRSRWAPEYFRIHVGGDFLSVEYAQMWARVAERNPHVNFLAFTKQFNIVRPVRFHDIKNFTLRLSDWPGIDIPNDLLQYYHVAWLDDGTRPAETFPKNALRCPGNCETCGACWKLDRDTVFKIHGSAARKTVEK